MPTRDLLTLALAPLGAALVLAGVVSLGPWSPFAFDGATARLGGGDSAGAIVELERLGKGWRTPALRAEAWRRAGLVRLAGGDPAGAARAFEHAVDLEPGAEARAELLRRLAALYEGPLGDHRACAEAFEQAAAQGHPGSADEADAARCWMSAALPGPAGAALQRASARGEGA